MMTFSCLQTLTETSALPGFWACSPSDSDWNYTAALLGLQLASYRPWGLISLRDCVCHFLIISISLPLSLFLLVLFLWRILVKMGGKCCVPSHSVVSDSVTPWAAACQAPLSMGILQARILEWVAAPSLRGSSQPRDRTQVSHIAGRFFTTQPPGKPGKCWGK